MYYSRWIIGLLSWVLWQVAAWLPGADLGFFTLLHQLQCVFAAFVTVLLCKLVAVRHNRFTIAAALALLVF